MNHFIGLLGIKKGRRHFSVPPRFA